MIYQTQYKVIPSNQKEFNKVYVLFIQLRGCLEANMSGFMVRITIAIGHKKCINAIFIINMRVQDFTRIQHWKVVRLENNISLWILLSTVSYMRTLKCKTKVLVWHRIICLNNIFVFQNFTFGFGKLLEILWFLKFMMICDFWEFLENIAFVDEI